MCISIIEKNKMRKSNIRNSRNLKIMIIYFITPRIYIQCASKKKLYIKKLTLINSVFFLIKIVSLASFYLIETKKKLQKSTNIVKFFNATSLSGKS